MSFTFTNYAALPIPESPFNTALNRALQLYGTGQDLQKKYYDVQKQRELLPFVTPGAQQELLKKQLANQYSQIQNKYADPTMQAQLSLAQQTANQYTPNIKSEIALRLSQRQHALDESEKIKYMLNHPGYMGGSSAKDIQYLTDLGIIKPNQINKQIPQVTPFQPQNNTMQPQLQPDQYQPTSEPSQIGITQQSQSSPFQTGNPLVNAILNKPFAESAYKQKMLEGYNWSHLPMQTRSELIYQGLGMGVSPLQMEKYINQGMDIKQIAEKEGLDPENLPSPIRPPTTATLTRTQQVEQVGNELDYLNSSVTPTIKKYSNTWFGISPKELKDQLIGNPKDQKSYGEYIGALALQTGISNGRVLLEGGRPGITAMKAVKDSALQGISQHSPIRMTDIAYQAAQDFINEKLKKGASIRTTTGMNPFSEISKSKFKSKSKSENSNTGRIRNYNLQTGKFE